MTDLSMAALSAATACSTSVMMLPGPIALTLMLCRASASAMHLQVTQQPLTASHSKGNHSARDSL